MQSHDPRPGPAEVGGEDLRRRDRLRRGDGAQLHGRRCQQPLCQCRRSSTPVSESSDGVAGQATRCGVAAGIS